MIGIIGAMDSEIAHLADAMQKRTEQTICGITFLRGILSGCDTVLARAGVGKVNAALCAQAMILTYQPTLILNTGVAGALAPDLSVGCAVVAESLVEHDMDTTPLGEPAGLLNIAGKELVYIPTDKQAQTSLLSTAQSSGVPARAGIIASGDRFIANAQDKAHIRELFQADACEMEGAAIAHACYAANIPCAVLRVISDCADGSSHIDFPTFVNDAAIKSAAIVLSFLSKI